uniref:Uncharacterized protein n=1 Tax=Oryza glumipatula TaxID=40148 RepID=A0A0D9Z5D3_9ORYZ
MLSGTKKERCILGQLRARPSRGIRRGGGKEAVGLATDPPFARRHVNGSKADKAPRTFMVGW